MSSLKFRCLCNETGFEIFCFHLDYIFRSSLSDIGFVLLRNEYNFPFEISIKFSSV